jgi:hypothetical protein
MPSLQNRKSALAAGICPSCCKRPQALHRVTCHHCITRASIQNYFKHRRGPASVHGSCFVAGYQTEWLQIVFDKFDGHCLYTGAAIQIGGEETASVTLDIPRHLVKIYGEAKVLHHENLVWCHRAVKRFKGQLTGDDFKRLWNDLTVGQANSS